MSCDVRVAYGPIEWVQLRTRSTRVLTPRSRDTIKNAVTARLQQASPTNNHACLLDACMEATECFV